MIRRFAALCAAQTCASVFLAVMIAGCGGNADVTVVSGNGKPTPLPGTAVSGQVRMPKGQVASAPASFFTRMARVVVAKAEALSGAVLPVGSGVLVQLFQIEPSDIVNGVIQGGKFLGDGDTNGSGFYQIEIPVDVSEETCHLIVEVGTGNSLTRAFVSSFSAPIDISFESETVVRLILAKVAAGVPFCNFSNQDIDDLLAAVHSVPGTAVGDNAGAINQNAFALASVDPTVQEVLNSAGLNPTNTPTRQPTRTPTPTNTNTAVPPTTTGTPSVTVTRTPSATPSASPTHTGTASPTPTSSSTVTASASRTASPTATNTPTTTNTPTSTNTLVPTPTFTNTVIPTATFTNTEVPTSTPTNTSIPTATNTAIPTSTNTSVPTATVPSGNINVGNGIGSPGDTVAITVTLSNSGGIIVATSNDLVYDSALVSVALKSSQPDCTIGSGAAGAGKMLVVSLDQTAPQATVLRIGVLGFNTTAIPDGQLFSCNFVIAANALPGDITLMNVPGASNASSNAVPVGGTAGTISVTAKPTTTSTAPLPTATPTTPVPPGPAARLSAPIGPSDTTITLDDISQLPDSGTVLIGSELISYNGKQPLSGGGGSATGQPGMLLNVQRGVGGTTPQSHSSDDAVVVVSASGPSVNVGNAIGNQGDTVSISVILTNGGGIVSTSNDIVYDSSRVQVKLNSAQPDCALGAAASGAGKIVTSSLPGGPPAATILRVGILGFNVTVIPDGVLFTCNFQIVQTAAPGTQALSNIPGASNAASNPVTVGGTEGFITIQGGAPTATIPAPTATNAQPTATHTSAPTPTNTVAATATNTLAQPPSTATPTNTVAAPTPTTQPSGPSINVGTSMGAPGDTVTITVSLANGGGQIVSTSNDIVFDSSQVAVHLVSGQPDCTIGSTASGAGKIITFSLPGGPPTATILRVGILGFNVNVIPDGALFSCNFTIAQGVTSGTPIALTNVPGASNAASSAVPVGGSNGTITVQ